MNLHTNGRGSPQSLPKLVKIVLIVVGCVAVVSIGLFFFYLNRKWRCWRDEHDVEDPSAPSSVETEMLAKPPKAWLGDMFWQRHVNCVVPCAGATDKEHLSFPSEPLCGDQTVMSRESRSVQPNNTDLPQLPMPALSRNFSLFVVGDVDTPTDADIKSAQVTKGVITDKTTTSLVKHESMSTPININKNKSSLTETSGFDVSSATEISTVVSAGIEEIVRSQELRSTQASPTSPSRICQRSNNSAAQAIPPALNRHGDDDDEMIEVDLYNLPHEYIWTRGDWT